MPDFDALNAKLRRLEDQLSGGAIRDITSSVAQDAKRDIEQELDQDLGGDRRFSGWSRVRLSARYELQSDHTALLSPRPGGPWSVLDGGRKAGGAVPKRRKSVILNTPWGPRTYLREKPMRLGATRGKNTWKNARTTIDAKTPERVHKHVQTVLARIF